jgi:hypothetical protein
MSVCRRLDARVRIGRHGEQNLLESGTAEMMSLRMDFDSGDWSTCEDRNDLLREPP